MIKKEDIKVGLLIWWGPTNGQLFAPWSCPAVVTAMDSIQFRLQRLDDFTETPWLIDSPSDCGANFYETMMRPCTIEEVREYFDEQERKIGYSMLRKVSEIEKITHQKIKHIREVQKFFETYS